MSFAERISVIIDVAADKATSAVNDFKTRVNEAEGAGGKLKAGMGSAFDSVKANAGALKAIGGAAIAGFVGNALDSFVDLTTEVDKFSQTLGSTPEDASRLLAVFKPLGIELGDAQDVFGNLASLINDNDSALSDLGVTVAKGKDGRVDMNETFLRIIDALKGVEDPAKKAAMASKFFGEEGARQFGPLLDTTRDLRKELEEVSDSQVIDQGEIRKGKELREAMTKLKAAFTDITLAVGELVAAAGPALDLVAKGVSGVASAVNMLQGEGMNDRVKEFADLAEEGRKLGITQDDLNTLMTQYGIATDETNAALKQLIESKRADIIETVKASEETRQLSKDQRDDQDAADKAAQAHDGLSKDRREDAAAARELSEATRESEQVTREYNDALAILKGHLDQREAVRNFEEAMMSYRSQVDQSEETTDDYIGKLATVISQLDSIPEETKTKMIAELDEGNIDYIESRLYWLTRDRTVSINGQLVGSTLRNTLEGRASGGDVQAGRPYRVGELGTETFIPEVDGRILNPTESRALGAGTTYIDNSRTIVNAQQVTPELVKRLDRRYDRRNGLS